MRRPSLLLLPALLVAALAAPASAGPTSRTLTKDYNGTTVTSFPVPVSGQNGLLGLRCGDECVEFDVATTERSFALSLADTSNGAVGWLASEQAGASLTGCGSGRIVVRAKEHWYVQPAALDKCSAQPTRGRLTVTISR